MAGPVPAIHFPEAAQASFRLWKMDGRHEGGHDGMRVGIETVHKNPQIPPV
jgi:hypothetical protein